MFVFSDIVLYFLLQFEFIYVGGQRLVGRI
jgi:hypothetical protein